MNRGHSVLAVRHVDAVPVDISANRQFVRDRHLDRVAHFEVNPRTWHHPVLGPRLHDLAGRDLPVDDRRGQLKMLGPVGEDLGLQRLIAMAAVSAGNANTDSVIAASWAAPSAGVISSWPA